MIYFVRHGQTDDNANGNLLSGWTATPLNEIGIAQAKDRAKDLRTFTLTLATAPRLHGQSKR